MEDRQAILRDMKICRFCLTENHSLKSIYNKDKNNAVPLPLQIMACVALEVFASDGMPQLICENCIDQTQQAYNFKTLCKRSDDALRLFLATGVLKRGDDEVSIISVNTQQKRSSSEEKSDLPSSKRRKSNEKVSKNKNAAPKKETSPSKELVTPKKEVVKVVTDDNSEIVINTPSKDTLEPTADTPQEKPNEINIETQGMEIEIQTIQIDENNDYNMKVLGNENEETQLLFEDPLAIPDANSNPGATLTPHVIKTHCFSCNHCDRSFPLQQLLEIHERNHTRERKFQCKEPQCEKRFFSKHDLNKHMQTHSSNKPFSCVVCQKSFSRITLLRRHEKIHVEVPKFLCTYCEKTFLTSESLDEHMKDHKKSRPFACGKCDKRFAFKQGLERHEVSHAAERPYKCNYCSESFTIPSKLQRHITSHAGNRPYPCKVCNRTFVLSHHLTRHMKSHFATPGEEIGNFKCDVCSMSFKKKYLLINHSAIHSMVNLKCVICNREFEDAQTVKDHITTHLGGYPYECYKCEYSFETEAELTEHELKHSDPLEDESYDENSPIAPSPPQETPRRSSRSKRTKTYTDFLKSDDLSSDSSTYENENYPTDENSSSEEYKDNIFHPLPRNDSLKTYKGKDKKSLPKNLKVTTLETLGIPQSTLDSMNLTKSNFVEMKIGQKIIRVQKLMMTKAEVDAMSEQGKLDIKGGKVLVKNVSQGFDLNKLTKKIVSAANLPLPLPLQVQGQSEEVDKGNKDKAVVKTYTKKVIKKEGGEVSKGGTVEGDKSTKN